MEIRAYFNLPIVFSVPGRIIQEKMGKEVDVIVLFPKDRIIEDRLGFYLLTKEMLIVSHIIKEIMYSQFPVVSFRFLPEGRLEAGSETLLFIEGEAYKFSFFGDGNNN